MKHDVPPPYTAVSQHAVFPKPTHDEAARYNFLTAMNKYLSGGIGAGNKIAYDTQVLPAFQAEHGRDPQDRFEIRDAMNENPWHRYWSALKRNTMEMRQQNGRAITLRQADELSAKIRQFNEGRDTLQLNPDLPLPHYMDAADIHCMPGSYHGEEREGDFSAGANYDSGLFATTGGGLGALSDGAGQAIVHWIRNERPDWQPRRILDLGCTVGHSAVPLAQAFPDAEVIAIDTAAAVLRYGHARAQALGVKNIRFVQMNAEDLSAFPDGHFDWVQTTMYLHELSGKALPRIIQESERVLASGGLMFHLEQPQYTEDMPFYEQFIRDWDAFNNNEPFWSAMHAMDLKDVIAEAGLPKDCQFTARVRAYVDHSVFPPAVEGEEEDHGRAAAWNAYGAWKP
jgi:ubiquinone/menaquinone biosynthesis C-methylase UbiE